MLAIAALAIPSACVDQDDFLGPQAPARLQLVPQYSQLGAAAAAPITRIRLIATAEASGEVLGTFDDGVDPTSAFWRLELRVNVGDEPVAVLITVEMFNAAGAVEWSGMVGPIELATGTQPAPVAIEVFRGPLDNLGITDVEVAQADTTLTEGDLLALSATVQGGGESTVVYWGTSDSTRARVSAAGLVTTLLPTAAGATVQVVAVAGPRADTVQLVIRQRIASVDLTPDTLRFQSLGEQQTMLARVLDARGDTVRGRGGVIWSIADSTVARHLGGGVFEALAFGSTDVTAAAADSTMLSAVGHLIIERDPQAPLSCQDPPRTSHSGTIKTSQTWTRDGSPHLFSGTFTVDSAAVLTIEPGAIVCGESYAYLYFINGARLDARGTAALPILISAADTAQPWSGVYLEGDPADSSHIAHATLEYGAYSNGLVYASSLHPVVIEDAVLRHAVYVGAYVYAAGSVLRRVTVQDARGSGYYGLLLGGNGIAVRGLTITGGGGTGLYVTASNTVLDSVFISGTAGDGLFLNGTGTTISRLRIENAGGVGFNTGYSGDHLLSASGVRVVGGASYGARVGINDLALIAPTPADQDSLLGNARDTLVVLAGSLRNRTLTLRADVPWILEGTAYVDSASTLLVQPGGRLFGGPYAQLFAYNGGSIDARGTAAQPITFTSDSANAWYGITLYSAVPDTSRFSNALFEYSRNTGLIYSYGQHATLLDSVRVRRATYSALYLGSSGSRVSRSAIDTTLTTSYPAVQLGSNVVFEDNVVRGAAGDGVQVFGNNVTMLGGRIENSAGIGLTYSSGYTAGQGAPVRIVGGASYPIRASISAFARIYPDVASQDSLLGNAIDTILIAGGTAYFDTATVRADLPWRLETWTSFDSTSVLNVQPGATIAAVQYSQLIFSRGSTLQAIGTSGAPVSFVASDPALHWYGLQFDGTPGDTSRLVHALISNGGISGNGAIYAIGSHPVRVENSRIRNSQYRAVYFGSAGSTLRASTVDTTLTSGWPAVELLSNTRFESSTIRGAAGTALQLSGTGIVLQGGLIEGAGGIGMYAGSSNSIAAGSTPPRITGGLTHPVQIGIQPFAVLFPDVATQDSLLGNASDTVVITGGSLYRDTTTVRADLPWRIDSWTSFDSTSVLNVQAGGTIAAAQYSQLIFSRGSTLQAIGTSLAPIRFVASDPALHWYGLQFDGTPGDTSRLVHALISNGGISGNGAIYAVGSHPVRVENSRIRNSQYRAVYLGSAGSMLRASTIDTTLTSGWPAVELLSNTRFESSTIRGAAGTALQLSGTGILLQGGRIEGAGGIGMYAGSSQSIAAGSQPPRITGGLSYPVRIGIQPFATLFPTAAAQDSLLGNAVDTVAITGGIATRDTATVRADLPWRLETWTYFDSTSVLNVQPGGAVAGVASSQLLFRSGSTLQAIGTLTDSVRFTSVDPGQYWYGLQFQDAPTDTSRIVYGLIENGGHTGNGPLYATGSHVLVVDSSRVRNSQYKAVYLNSPGSMLRWTTVDTTATASTSYPAVQLGASGTRIERGTIRGAALVGLHVNGVIAEASVTPRIVGSGGSPLNTPIQGFAALFDTRADQDSVLGNARDTVLISGGTLAGDTVLVGASLPWRLETWTYLTSNSRMNVEPRATVAGVASSQLLFQTGSTLRAIGTVTDSVHFRSVDPAGYWYGLQFQDAPTDTSRIVYGLIANGGHSGNGAIYTSNSHVVVVDSSRIRRSQYRAVYLNSPGSMLRWTTIDTTLTASTSYPAVDVNAANVLIERGTIRGAALVGLRVTGSGSLVEGSVTPTVTGSGSYPMHIPIAAFASLFDTRADHDSLYLNGRDTISIQGGTLVGDTVLVGSSLPWRLETWTYLTSNSRMNVEPGATIAGATSSQLLFQTGSTLRALGTTAAPITFTSADPAGTWYGMQFEGTPTDTSRIRLALVANGGSTGNSPLFATNSHVVVLDSINVRNSTYRAVYLNSAGSMLLNSTVDTTLTVSASYPAVQLIAGTIMRGTRVRGAAYNGILASGLATVDNVEVVGSGHDGFVSGINGQVISNSNIITNGFGTGTGAGIFNSSTTTTDTLDASRNWWGSAQGAGSGTNQVDIRGGPITTTGPLGAAATIPAWEAP